MIGGFHPWFSDELTRRIEGKRLERLESLSLGACGDFADYRYAIGFFDGLKEALEIANDIRKDQEAA